MPLAAAGLHQFFKGRFRILGRAVLPMPLLNFAGRHRSALAFNPFDQPALFAVIVGFGQQRVDSPGLGLEPLG